MGDLEYLFDRSAEVEIRYRDLPHWRQDGKLYFVTWRQADSIAKIKRERLLRERDAFIALHGDPMNFPLSGPLLRRYHKLFNERVQLWLDSGHGSCMLRQLQAQMIVREALHHFNDQRYRLGSFAIAGNHVHALVVPFHGVDLSRIMHSWKSFTANRINQMLGRTGPFWHTESYDHLVRNEASLRRIEAYIHAHVDQGAYVERRSLS